MPVIELGQRRELFVDDFLIERLEGNLRPVLHQARPCEAILETDRPWEGCFSNFNTVMAAHPRHRLYYRGWQAHLEPGKKLEEARPPTINLAESEDGLRWERVPVRPVAPTSGGKPLAPAGASPTRGFT